MWGCVCVCVLHALCIPEAEESRLAFSPSTYCASINDPCWSNSFLLQAFCDSKALISIFSHSLSLFSLYVCVCPESMREFLWRVKLTFSNDREGGECSPISSMMDALLRLQLTENYWHLWSCSDREQSFKNLINTWGAELKNWPINIILHLKLL